MKIRNLLVAGLAMALVSSSFAAYNARLWFSDHTQNSNDLAAPAGQIQTNPGDEIWLNFSFSLTDSNRPNQWSILQFYMDLTNACCMTDADALTFDTVMAASFKASAYQTKIFWEPDDTDGNAGEITGAIYNDAHDPGNNTKPLVTMKGLYALIGVDGSNALSQNITKLGFFKFHVAPGCNGQVLTFGRDTGMDANGIWTQLFDGDQNEKKINDNWIRCGVPEPGTFAALATGLVGLLALRRRK